MAVFKIEVGKVEIYFEESIVENMHLDTYDLFSVKMEKKIELITTIPEGCPRKWCIDVGKLE